MHPDKRTAPQDEKMHPRSKMGNRVTVEIAHEKEYVLGYPIVVRLTIRPAADHAVSLFEESEFRHYHTLLRLTDDATGEVRLAQTMPTRPPAEGNFGAPLRLDAGQTQSFLVDLSDDIPIDIAPGTYRAVVEFQGSSSAPFELVMREPTPSERARIAALKGEVDRFETWGAWVHGGASNGKPQGVVTATDPARFFIVYRYLIWGTAKPAQVPPSYPDVLDGGIYAAAAAVLRADLAVARGDQSGAKSELERARAAHPEVSWQLDLIEKVGSKIAFTRPPDP